MLIAKFSLEKIFTLVGGCIPGFCVSMDPGWSKRRELLSYSQEY